MGYLKIVDSLPCIVLGVCAVKNAITCAERKLFILQEESDSAGCHILCRVKLVVIMQYPDESDKTSCLSHCITKASNKFLMLPVLSRRED